jgi:DNA-binding GntR family transcriptional regulator
MSSALKEHPESVVELTIVAIRNAIKDGRFAPGQRLVVADVTRMFGVSNGPVREAIRRLTGEGLVDIQPHRGAVVREYKSKDIREIFEVREMVEGLAARLAAERGQAGDGRTRLEAALEDMRRSVAAQGAGYVEHNHDFHQIIYDMAGNQRVQDMAAQLTLPIYRMRFHYLMDPNYAKTSASEHELIAEAIFAGDGPRAERMMRNHIRNSAAAMLEAVEASAAADTRRVARGA